MQAFILDNKDKVKKKIEMLQSLSDIQIATKLLEAVSKSDNEIDSNYEKLGCKIVPVDPSVIFI
jgi:poly [ADP-ribose] polymerase